MATGPVDELRDRGADARRVRMSVELRDGATPDDLRAAARAAGTVTDFGLERPTLTDLFREAVAT